jgi:hypothetical protein
MKYLLLIVLSFLLLCRLEGQETPSTTIEQQLENLAEVEEVETEDDSYVLQLEKFKRHPINLNTASADELKELRCLTDLQIDNFLSYRRLLGKLVHSYELQAVPTWDSSTIQRVLPYTCIKEDKGLWGKINQRWKGGERLFLIRYAQVLEKSKGFDKPPIGNANYYPGSNFKFLFRYQYNYKNLLQWGLLGDKDAGEALFKGNQRQGFDFYSFHFFARKLGIVKMLALGDFTINMGQGLIQWQGLAFKKSVGTMLVKRQAAVLSPYHSSGEYLFHRGLGITLQKDRWEASLFASLRKISANEVRDSVNHSYFSSILTSGYHRTKSENEGRNSLKQLAFGGNINYRYGNGKVGINVIQYRFSGAVTPAPEPYRLFAFNGTSITNASVDYGFTWRNMHFFGEGAIDQRINGAILNGLLLSASGSLDISIVHRIINKSYQSLNANAFTENSLPVNESGFYTGLAIRPFRGIKIDAYADVFRFPWLKYRVSAPSAGKEYLIQFTYTPDKQLEMYFRYRHAARQINRSNPTIINEIIDEVARQQIRWQTNWRINNQLMVRNRLELIWYDKKGPAQEQGFLAYIDGFYEPAKGSLKVNMRLQYVETEGYNSRLYAYENDLLYSYSIPAFSDKGLRYYLNLHSKWQIKASKKSGPAPVLSAWLRWSQTVYSGKTAIGAGLDEIKGNKKSEIKGQLLLYF